MSNYADGKQKEGWGDRGAVGGAGAGRVAQMKPCSWTVACYYNSLSDPVNSVSRFSTAANDGPEVITGLAQERLSEQH